VGRKMGSRNSGKTTKNWIDDYAAPAGQQVKQIGKARVNRIAAAFIAHLADVTIPPSKRLADVREK
jgi:hypothetical protein